tara:strand:- start:435 stop:1088 length:654 start_codon:yes stop_codon:yes gene_type:complete
MKIKLTESQYNRLLTEDTGENWGRVSKTVNPFMVKVFEKIRDKIQNGELKMNYNIVDYIMEDLVLTQEEAIILAHNFKIMVDFHSQHDLKELIGKPLEYMGVWKIPTSVPTTIEIVGRGYPDANIYVMGKTPQEALKNIRIGDVEDFVVGEMDLNFKTIENVFDLDDIEEINPQKEMVKDDFYDEDNQYEVLPYKNDEDNDFDLSRYNFQKLLSNIG